MNLEGDTGVTFLDEIIAAWRRQRNSERLSDRAMDTLRTKALRGFGLGKTPYGYGIGANGKLEIVEQEARVVRQLYQMYVEQNLGLRLIARHLNDANTPTRRGSRWSVVTVRDILRNRTYTGTYSRFGMRVPGSHPAIIPPDVFRAAQKKREHVSGGRPVGRESSFSLSGLAYCGACNGQHDRRQPHPELVAQTGRRPHPNRVSLLPLRFPGEPEYLQLSHLACRRPRVDCAQ